VVIVGATDDERLPRELVQRLYDASNEPKELVRLRTERREAHGQRRASGASTWPGSV
jgi:hypothetical protein